MGRGSVRLEEVVLQGEDIRVRPCRSLTKEKETLAERNGKWQQLCVEMSGRRGSK